MGRVEDESLRRAIKFMEEALAYRRSFLVLVIIYSLFLLCFSLGLVLNSLFKVYVFKSITSFSEYVDYAISIGAVMLVSLLGKVITTYSSWLRDSLKSTSVSILTLLDKRTKILSWIITLIFLIIGVVVAYVILGLFNLRPTFIYLVPQKAIQ